MQRQGFEQQMQNERNPSVCACGEDEDGRYAQQSYYRHDMGGAPIRLYGESNVGYSAVTVTIVALVAIIIGYVCAKFDIPMRFFSGEA